MNQTDYFEIKKLLLEQKAMIETLFPKKMSISFIKERTGLTRQAIRQKLINNFEPEVDYWLSNGRIFVSQKVAVTILTRSSK